ncbi:MAG: SDR family NAD(P)-dependent oxidoreductase [Candidatus Geothermarchaeales archaeon]
MSILITGGTGFIGAHLAKKLVEEGRDVVLFDVAPNYKIIADIVEKAKVVRGDLAQWTEVLDAVKRYDVESIFHLGAILSAAAEARLMPSYKVNFDGTIHVLEAARLFDVDKVIYTSSIAAFGPGVPQPLRIDAPQRPTTSYGISKVFSELWGLYYYNKFGIDFRALRFPSVIGPGRGPGGASAYSTLTIQKPALGEPYRVEVKEETRLPILYFKDGVSALKALHDAERPTSRVYNIAGFSPTAKELVDMVKKYIPDADIEFAPKPEIDAIVKSWPYDIDDREAREELGWKPAYPLDLLVRDFIEELRAKKHMYG